MIGGRLTRVRPFVRLEMRALGVHLVTARHVAPVNLPPAYRHVRGSAVVVDGFVVVIVVGVRFAGGGVQYRRPGNRPAKSKKKYSFIFLKCSV